MLDFQAVGFIMISNAERQARWRRDHTVTPPKAVTPQTPDGTVTALKSVTNGFEERYVTAFNSTRNGVEVPVSTNELPVGTTKEEPAPETGALFETPPAPITETQKQRQGRLMLEYPSRMSDKRKLAAAVLAAMKDGHDDLTITASLKAIADTEFSPTPNSLGVQIRKYLQTGKQSASSNQYVRSADDPVWANLSASDLN